MKMGRDGLRLGLSGALIGLAWLTHLVGALARPAGFSALMRSLAGGMMIAAAMAAGLPIALRALQGLRYRLIGVDLLVSIAAVGALLIGEFWEAAAVTFLFQLGAVLESQALGKTRSALQKLVSLAPDRASVLREGGEVVVPAAAVTAGETVVVRSGERIAVDGRVTRGRATVNQAAVTGESVPVEKEPGLPVFSGTVLETGYLEVGAERVGADTTFARIVELVEQAQDAKAPTQRFVERFARYYTPAVIGLTILTYAVTGNLERALTLLVIACPGALVISTPASVVAAIGAAARQGILVKGGQVLEKASRVSVVAFDKTGTLTRGRPEVTALQAFGITDRELLRLAAAAEQRSEHHLARAIVQAARQRQLDLPAAEHFQVLPGMGVAAQLTGLAEPVLVGNRPLMAHHGVATPPAVEAYCGQQEEAGRTAVLVAVGGQVLGVVSVADPVRPEAAATVRALQGTGVARVVMLTGDNRKVAADVAKTVGISDVHAGLLPQDKVQWLREYHAPSGPRDGGAVAMVGDGLNDAPALAAADLGVAIGDTATDVALDTADMVILSDRLDRLATALMISRAAMRNMRQNLVFAVAVVLALLAGVLGGGVFLAGGMLIHEASVLLVVLNATRLLRAPRQARSLSPAASSGVTQSDGRCREAWAPLNR